MGIYHIIYNNVCSNGVKQKSEWVKGSGLHRHHVKPTHAGGTDDESNFTYLSIREHIIAHYLLWKINGNVNDLRSMYMLGGNLTPLQRSTVGRWCSENKIGMHAASKEERLEWASKGARMQINNQIGIHDPANFSKFGSIGGKASLASSNNKKWLYWMSAEGRHERAKMGAAASAKIPATDGKTTKKFHTKVQREEFLKINPVWWAGVHWKPRGKNSY